MQEPALRDRLQAGIYTIIDPFVKLLIKMGLTPNAVTMVGFILNIGVAVIFVVGGEEGNRGDLSYIGWAGALVLFAGLFDMLDGQVARIGKMSSSFGALFDSVLDRYSELFTFLGICYYLVAHHYLLSSLFAFIGLIGSMMVSYTRARAEGLGIQCKGGLMQRPERIVLIGVSALACGITAAYIGGNYKLYIKGIPFHIFETMSVFTIPIAILAILTNITAIRRLLDAKAALAMKDKQQKSTLVAVLFLWMMTPGSGYCHASAGKYIFHKPVIATNRPDSFPVPKPTANQLFYLQRTPNANTVVYELSWKGNHQLNEDEPIHVYWVRFAEKGQQEELTYTQRTFAYGMKATALENGKYELHFVSYKKYPMYLMKSATDNKYHIYGTIQRRQAIINRIFVKITGGSFWLPTIEYVELNGTDAATGMAITERMKI